MFPRSMHGRQSRLLLQVPQQSERPPLHVSLRRTAGEQDKMRAGERVSRFEELFPEMYGREARIHLQLRRGIHP